MSKVEAIFRVRDNQSEGGWKDGMVVEVRAPGAYMSPRRMEEWFQTGIAPNRLRRVGKYRRDRLTRDVEQCRTLLTEAVVDVEALAREAYPGMPLQEAMLKISERADDCRRMREFWMKEGIDTNFTHRELRSFGVAIIDLDMVESDDLTTPPVELRSAMSADDEGVERRSFKLRYETAFSGGSAGEWRDRSKKILVARGEAPVTWADIVEEVE